MSENKNTVTDLANDLFEQNKSASNASYYSGIHDGSVSLMKSLTVGLVGAFAVHYVSTKYMAKKSFNEYKEDNDKFLNKWLK